MGTPQYPERADMRARRRAARRRAIRRRRLALLAAVALAGTVGAWIVLRDSGTQGPPTRPNIVVVMTDDQDVASMRVMDHANSLFRDSGVSFSRSYVTTSMCCPSRTSFLTGQFAHNHGTLLADLEPPRSRYRSMSRALNSNLALWLQDAGYRTALVGKYLNGYGMYDRREQPPGWDDWDSMVGDNSIYGFDRFTLNENGHLHRYAKPGTYQTDVLTRKAVDFIERGSGPDPFFLYLAYVAPHIGHGGPPECVRGAQPAPRDAGAFARKALPRSPSFDERGVSGKPEYVQRLPHVTGETLKTARTHYRCRLESLLAVDRGVGALYSALKGSGELDDTVIVFTSDNGYMEGEHRLVDAKFFPYEESLRVPLIVWGAGGESGSTDTGPVLNIDLAPTILDLAGASAPASQHIDGRSFLPVLEGEDLPDRDLLFEGYSAKHTGSRGRRYFASVQRDELLYTEYRTGERELYDLSLDPDQLQNLAGSSAGSDAEEELSGRLDELSRCAGSADQPVAGQPPCD